MRRVSSSIFARAAALVGALCALGCVPAGDGVQPPKGRIYFPIGVNVDSTNEFLFVVSSDFDLQFNQGTVQSLSLDRIRALVRRPCTRDTDCDEVERCDTAPSAENQREPSYFCVDRTGEYAGFPCGSLREQTASERAVSPGRCAYLTLEEPEDGGDSLIIDQVEISAFATQSLLLERPSTAPGGAPARLFVPVRGDSSLHYLDLEDDGTLTCGQGNDHPGDESRELRCSDEYRVTVAPPYIQAYQEPPDEEADDEDAEPEELEVSPEPFEIAATSDGRVLAVTHQTQAAVSTFINDWVVPPFLVDRLEVSTVSPIGIAALAQPRIVSALGADYQAGFLMTALGDARVSLLRFFDDGAFALLDQAAHGEEISVDPGARPEMFEAATSPIRTNSVGTGSRGIAIDDAERRAAEDACADGDTACLDEAARVPLVVYVANRGPNSLLIGTTDSRDALVAADDLPTFHDSIPLTAGPSRVVIGEVTTPSGVRERRVFVICFDSALVYVFDPIRKRLETEIFTGRGPHSLAFDGAEPLLYVGHFTDSYVGVVSLDQRHTRTYGAMVAALGEPTPPRASQ